jgi:hypothetical protein
MTTNDNSKKPNGVEGNVYRLGLFVTAVQLSAYKQDDGRDIYAVETLHSDDTWDIVATTGDKADAWLLAGDAANGLGVPLLPVSSFPGRAA